MAKRLDYMMGGDSGDYGNEPDPFVTSQPNPYVPDMPIEQPIEQQPWLPPQEPQAPPVYPGGTPNVPPTAVSLSPEVIAPSIFPSWVTANPPATPTVQTPAAAAAPTPAAATNFSLQGFDSGKLNDSSYINDKYTPSAHLFASVIQGLDPVSTPVQAVVDRVNAAGGHATAVGDDRIDFGDGYGPIDVKINSGLGGWWFQNGEDRFGITGGGGTGNPNGSTTGGTGGTGTAGAGSAGGGSLLKPADLTALMAQIHSMFPAPASYSSGPNLSGPGPALTPGLNQVGSTPFDQQMNQSLSDLLANHGQTPYGQQIAATLADIISQGGASPPTRNRLITARDEEAGAMQAQTADARNELASRGFASVPGSPEGPEATAISRISERLAPTYANAVSDIESHAADTANASLMTSLQMATGLASNDANNILNAIGTGTARQTALANIALRTLEDNQQWNEFLANFGLTKDQVTEQLAQGRITALVPLLQMFLQLAGQSAQGFIGQ